MKSQKLATLLMLLLGLCLTVVQALTPLSQRRSVANPALATGTAAPAVIRRKSLGQTENNEDSAPSPSNGVVELGDEEESDMTSDSQVKDLPNAVSGPLFISQGEVDPDTLNPDFSNAKQTRVVLYTILSLLPVLLLIPFMLGRDFIPADVLPPVDMN
jgi:hypothetical protein